MMHVIRYATDATSKNNGAAKGDVGINGGKDDENSGDPSLIMLDVRMWRN